MMSKIIFIVISLCVLGVIIEGRKENEKPCYHKEKNMPGVCKKLKNCLSRYDDLINGIKFEKCTSRTYCCIESPAPSMTILNSVDQEINMETKVGEKSREMCKKYEDLAFAWQEAPTLLFGNELEKKRICTREYIGSTIIYGGKLAEKGEFPHMALIGYGQEEIKWACGGSLISDKYVLTAAHCLRLLAYGTAVRVRLGDLNITSSSDDEYVQEIAIKKAHKHRKYVAPSTYHDIAIFELEHPAELSEYVKPICIYTEKKMPEQVIATGWGYTENSTRVENDVLLKVGLDVYNSSKCSEAFPASRYHRFGFNNKTQICAGSSEAKDTCQGDSGGPIQINNNDTACSYYILGITSHGASDCGTAGIPAIYVKIFPYIAWIESIVWP